MSKTTSNSKQMFDNTAGKSVGESPLRGGETHVTAGIIAEYNPFHNGHKLQIEKTRAETGATHIVAVMSGNFTQRGDVAIVDKHVRTKAALENGVDLVIELPCAFVLSSAEQFATGAVSILNALGCIDVLSFGSECGNIELLEEAAGAVHYTLESEEFHSAMRRGKSYPAALQSAMEEFYTDDVVEVFAHPNNTLAVEYIKALNESGSNIKPFTIERVGAAHDEYKDEYDSIVSASQIRQMLIEGKMVSGVTPMDFDERDGDSADYADIRKLETAILAKLRMLSPKEIKKAPNVQSGLENRIFKAARMARNLSELYFLTKTKRYTLARIRRAVLCCFLGITQGDIKHGVQYVRVLGMNEKGREILANSNCELPINTSLAALMKKSDGAKKQVLLEERCTNIYGLAFKKKRECGLDFSVSPIKL
ncbi:MAG: nucleotidyltransferase family protein [Oscillospiraceae bacterium]|nr:nucleotidyltransferase family protein [Oscillospiraceae bacterium]